jgi:hypothetical protein
VTIEGVDSVYVLPGQTARVTGVLSNGTLPACGVFGCVGRLTVTDPSGVVTTLATKVMCSTPPWTIRPGLAPTVATNFVPTKLGDYTFSFVWPPAYAFRVGIRVVASTPTPYPTFSP